MVYLLWVALKDAHLWQCRRQTVWLRLDTFVDLLKHSVDGHGVGHFKPVSGPFKEKVRGAVTCLIEPAQVTHDSSISFDPGIYNVPRCYSAVETGSFARV